MFAFRSAVVSSTPRPSRPWLRLRQAEFNGTKKLRCSGRKSTTSLAFLVAKCTWRPQHECAAKKQPTSLLCVPLVQKNTFFLLYIVYSCFANPTFPRRKFPSPSCHRTGKISSAKLPDVGLLEQTADLFSSLAFRSEVWRLPGTFLGHCPPSTRHVRPGCWMGDRLTTMVTTQVAPLTCCALVGFAERCGRDGHFWDTYKQVRHLSGG